MSHTEPINSLSVEAIEDMCNDYFDRVEQAHGKDIADLVDMFMRFHVTGSELRRFFSKHNTSDAVADELAEMVTTSIGHILEPLFYSIKVDKEDQHKAYDLSKHLIEQLNKMAEPARKVAH